MSYNLPIYNTDNWPRIVQFSWQVYDVMGNIIEFENYIIKPENYDIPFNAFKIHGITNDIADEFGHNLNFVLSKFRKYVEKSTCIVGHNIDYDIKVIQCEYFRKNKDIYLKNKKILDTKILSMSYCKLKRTQKKFKWPTLSELYQKLFNEKFSNSHNSYYDVISTSRCFLELLRIGIISHKEVGIEEKIINKFKNKHECTIPLYTTLFKNKYKNPYLLLNLKKKNTIIKYGYGIKKTFSKEEKKEFDRKKYSQIHNHTHFSILHSTINIKSLINKAISFNMPAVGITDYGNLMGSFYFLNAINRINEKYHPYKSIKGIVGCEIFISENYSKKKFTKEVPDKRYQQVFLSKNKKGFRNLSKLCSIGFTEGLYSGIPRIGKKIIENYKDNLIALTGDINAEIPYTILNYGERKAEKVFLWWKELFEDDFYVELLRHGLKEENYVNDILIKFSIRHNVKYIIQNNVFYLEKKESNVHDILLCIKNGVKQSTPIGKGVGYRSGFPNNEYYFKSSEEMKDLFSDFPESFDFLNELISKIEVYNISISKSNNISLPKFKISNNLDLVNTIDEEHKAENNFLKKITYEGAKKRYKNITYEVKNRIHFELGIIEKIKYPGYFLLVRSLILQAKKMNITVGPGRGSVAGSVVAYCIGITNIDPIKYHLLFERFLNPDRINLPDIDIDFDDVGREKIIEWIVKKYGKNRVAQIITYSTMGAKTSIRDVGRVLGLSLKETDKIAKMVPNTMSLKNLFSEDYSFVKMKREEINNIYKLKKLFNHPSNLSGKVLKKALSLEGTIRSTGIHACGIIITPYDIIEYIPVSISKDSNLLLTQYDSIAVELIGLLKIDLLGLKTLTIIKNTVTNIKNSTNISDISFSIEDVNTLNLFKKGKTIGIFQYESLGMRKYLRKLKPDKFNDIIAMNALYRPGPMKYIPNFISRKHGKELINYDFPEMKEILIETYGITIYQEQVMLIAQKLANFSKGEADVLRKAMGKKQKDILDKMKSKFIYQAINKGYNKNILEKIWKDWEYFSCYAFNKSHATCYAYIAFKTAYLKVHFPCEYMASVLSNNMNNIKNLTFFIEECKNMKISVIGPDINESCSSFKITGKNIIRFGLSGIKGVGKNAVKVILDDRIKNGSFLSIFDLVKRVDLRVVNKKTLENLILSGSLDSFCVSREQYFKIQSDEKLNTLEKIIRFESKYKSKTKNKKNNITISYDLLKSNNNSTDKWSNIYKLSKEKEVLGIYASSHPLDEFYYEKKYLTNFSIEKFKERKYISSMLGKRVYICGIISSIEKSSYSGIKYGIFILEDYHGSKEFRIYGKTYSKYESLLFKNNLLYLCISIDKSRYKEYKTSILYMYNLSTILTSLVTKLVIKINLKNLDNILIKNLEELFSKKIGNKNIEIVLYEKENNILLNFKSDKYKVNIDSIFLKTLEKIEGVDFCLN